MGGHRRGGHRRGGQRNKDNLRDNAAANAGQDEVQSSQRKRAAGLKPDFEDVLLAVESLYEDELKAFGRILRKRIGERAVLEKLGSTLYCTSAGQPTLPDIDVKHLVALCEGHESFIVAPEEGGDWSVTIKGRQSSFVDIYSSTDDYPHEFWYDADVYFQGLIGDDMLLPGGRYACAQALLRRSLPFLDGRSLGQVCHIVQLAISQRKILGYSNGAVVPYGHSQSKVKEECAEQQQALALVSGSLEDADSCAMPIATWDEARACLKQILESATVPGQEQATVPLSNVKRLFRSRFNVDLSETTLGHAKLSDLLQDARFSGVCTVQLQKHGYIVVQQKKENSSTCSDDGGASISLADSLPSGSRQEEEDGDGGREVVPQPRGFCIDQPLFFEVAHAFRATTSSPPTPLSSPPGLDVVPINARQDGPPRFKFCQDEPLCLEDARDVLPSSMPSSTLPLPSGLPTPLPSPGMPNSTTVRKWTGEPCRVPFCFAEPLRFEDESESGAPTPLPSPGVATTPSLRRWSDEPRRIEFSPNASMCLADSFLQVSTSAIDVQMFADEPTNRMFPAATYLDGCSLQTTFAVLMNQMFAGDTLCPNEPLSMDGWEEANRPEEVALPATPSMPTPLPSPGLPTDANVRTWQCRPREFSLCKDESPFADTRAGAGATNTTSHMKLRLADHL